MIENFIEEFLKQEGLPPYLYNLRKENFNEESDSVYYGGPYWDERELIAILKAVLRGSWIVSGEEVSKFEKAFSSKIGLRHSLMVNSGSSANLVMIAALKKHCGWENGDEIIVSAVGFPTTVSPIIQNQLTPVFVDIDYSDLNFSLEEVEAKVTSRTRAIFVSPVLGNPPDIDRLRIIGSKYSIRLILDGCDSLGTKWGGKEIYEYFYAASCSFYPAHHITTGEGGMVSSNDETLIDTARSFAWWGRDCYCKGKGNLLANGTCKKRFSCWIDSLNVEIDHKYYFTNIGYNLKPLDLQGAIGLVQLNKLDEIHHKRRLIKKEIQGFLSEIKGLRVVSEIYSKAEASWFGVPLVCETSKLKERLVRYLEGNRIQTRHYFAGNILLHPAYSAFGKAQNFPRANRVLEDVFFLGCSPTISEGAMNYLNKTVSSFR